MLLKILLHHLHKIKQRCIFQQVLGDKGKGKANCRASKTKLLDLGALLAVTLLAYLCFNFSNVLNVDCP